ncbi:hypothetical protein ACLOJK_039047 [Asimina triloba]
MVAPKSVKEVVEWATKIDWKQRKGSSREIFRSAAKWDKDRAKTRPRMVRQSGEELNEDVDLLDYNPRVVISLHALAGTPNLQSMKTLYLE